MPSSLPRPVLTTVDEIELDFVRRRADVRRTIWHVLFWPATLCALLGVYELYLCLYLIPSLQRH
jgi:hypothetical protein